MASDLMSYFLHRWLATPLAVWGKLPSHGDFLRHHVTPAQAHDWQAWVMRVWNLRHLADNAHRAWPCNSVRVEAGHAPKRRLQEKSASSPHATLASSYKNNSARNPWRTTVRTTCRRLLVSGLAVGVLAGVAALSGCAEQTSSPGVTGYNHQANISISTFDVNGSMGMGLMPQSGGGGTSCCVDIPAQWHPGIKVKVHWEEYLVGSGSTPVIPKEAEVEVPQYGRHDIGVFAVHFFPDHKVKVLVTMLDIQHPDYPAELRWGAPTPQ